MPDLERETLLEELEMEALLTRPQSPLVLLATGPSPSLEKPIDPADDLRRCVGVCVLGLCKTKYHVS